MGRACAKTILFGEHAVVYGYPGIAVPLNDFYTEVLAKKSDNLIVRTSFKLDKNENDKVTSLVTFLKNELNINTFSLDITSNFPVSSGFGSSASLSVAVIRELNNFFSLSLNKDYIEKLSFECEKIFHGNPSGIDTAVINHETPVFFENHRITNFLVEKPIYLVVANSGEKSDTKIAVSNVRNLYEKSKEEIERIFMDISKVTNKARDAIINDNAIEIGRLMTMNHNLLRMLNVSTDKLDRLVSVSLENGAYGAKLAGAGMGGNVIAICEKEKCSLLKEELMKYSGHVYVLEI